MRSVMAAALLSLLALSAFADYSTGCCCKGGPGFRLPNGKCSSWVQHARYGNGTSYPPGTVDERTPACLQRAKELGKTSAD